MKRNIIVAGVPRAGKSTLSSIIALHGFTHVSMDSIIAGFERVFPETGINTYAKMSSLDILINISAKIAPFISAMMNSGEYSEHGFGAVFDVYQLLPCDYMKYIKLQSDGRFNDTYSVSIVYLGSSDVTPAERFAIQKHYDTERDYTFYKSDDELREGAEYIVEQSKLIKSQCGHYDLPYFDTSYDRDGVFDKIMQMLIE